MDNLSNFYCHVLETEQKNCRGDRCRNDRVDGENYYVCKKANIIYYTYCIACGLGNGEPLPRCIRCDSKWVISEDEEEKEPNSLCIEKIQFIYFDREKNQVMCLKCFTQKCYDDV